MAEQMSSIPDDAIWITQRSIEGYPESSVAEFYLPESDSYIEAYLDMTPLDYIEEYPDDERVHLDGDDTIYHLTRWDNSPSVRQITKEDVVDSLRYALISEQALEGRNPAYDDWLVYNHSDRAASVIEDLKRELPADYDKIDNLYIGGYGFEHDSDSCTDTWRNLSYSTASKEFTLTVERKTYSTSEFEDPHVSTYDKLLSEKEALAFITDPRFRQALDYRSRVDDIINNLRREAGSERSDAERKETIMPEQTKRDIRIKDPDAPASTAQLELLVALAKNGVITPQELDAMGGAENLTKQAASDLINAHSQEEGFKAVQEARRAERAAANPRREAAPKAKEQAAGKNAYVHMKMPAAFLTPHTYTAKDGREFEKCFVHFPPDTKINGIDLSGYSCDVFLNDYMKNQMLSGEQVTVSFKADEKVAVWTGRKDDPQHPYDRKEVNPYLLAKGVKTANEGFREAKAAERAAERQEAKAEKAAGVTMKGMAEESRTSASALAGHDQPDAPATAR